MNVHACDCAERNLEEHLQRVRAVLRPVPEYQHAERGLPCAYSTSEQPLSTHVRRKGPKKHPDRLRRGQQQTNITATSRGCALQAKRTARAGRKYRTARAGRKYREYREYRTVLWGRRARRAFVPVPGEDHAVERRLQPFGVPACVRVRARVRVRV